MQLQVQLVHAEGGRLVVQVTGWDGDQCLGSALGEAAGAEEAEDRALARLQRRLDSSPAQAQPPVRAAAQSPVRAQATPFKESSSPLQERPAGKEPSLPGSQPKPARPPGPPSPFPAALTTKPTPGASLEVSPEPEIGRPNPLAASEAPGAAPPTPGALNAAERSAEKPAQLTIGANSSAEPTPARSSEASAGPTAELPADPEDWSDELAALDIQLQRLGWQRDQESIYLQRAFGHPSRSRLTSYGDLVAYLAAVRQLQAPADPTSVAVPMRRVDLLAQSDQLLAQLGWDAARGREVLETYFERSSRQQLNDEDLLRFNMILEGELITGMGGIRSQG